MFISSCNVSNHCKLKGLEFSKPFLIDFWGIFVYLCICKKYNYVKLLKIFIMVREEYLNPEFMYKFINSLCKNDGWNMYHFVFGKLWYKNLKQPILMQNNHGYNMVYKFSVYKLPKQINYGELDRNSKRYVYVSVADLKEKIIWKDIYFDILNECFVEHDDTVKSFEEFPSFFRLDNQIYYGIYGQPKVLRYHYCKGRECYSLENYMGYMGITAQNLYDPYSLLHNMIDEDNRCMSGPYDSYFSCFVFDTHEEANSKITKILSKDCDCEDFYFFDINKVHKSCIYDGGRRKPNTGYHELYIHNPNFPVFYTDNVLELTVPIAEAVEKLAVSVSNALNSIQYTLSLMSTSIQRLMCDRLEDVYQDRYWKMWDFILQTEYFPRWDDMKARCHKVGIEEIAPDREVYDAQLEEIAKHRSLTSKNVSKVRSDYGKLYSNIKKLQSSDFSLSKVLEISNGFKMLESKSGER